MIRSGSLALLIYLLGDFFNMDTNSVLYLVVFAMIFKDLLEAVNNIRNSK